MKSEDNPKTNLVKEPTLHVHVDIKLEEIENGKKHMEAKYIYDGSFANDNSSLRLQKSESNNSVPNSKKIRDENIISKYNSYVDKENSGKSSSKIELEQIILK